MSQQPNQWVRLSVCTSLMLGCAVTALAASPVTNTWNQWRLETSTLFGDTLPDSATSVDVRETAKQFVVGLNSKKAVMPKPTVLSTTLGTPAAQSKAQLLVTDDKGIPLRNIRLGGDQLDDVVIEGTQQAIVAIGDFGLVKLTPKDDKIAWQKSISQVGNATASKGRRVASGADGTIVALAGNVVYIYKPDGTLVKQFAPNTQGRPEDIAYDPKTKTVIVGGWSQKDGGGCKQLQTPWVRAYDLQAKQKWQAWDYSHLQSFTTESSCADSRITRVKIGLDNKLYFAGTTDGGNSIFRIHPRDLKRRNTVVKADMFTDTYGMKGAKKLMFFARMNPGTGDVEQGQFYVTRLSDGSGNSISPSDITASANGTVYLTGAAVAFFAGRDKQVINGKAIGAYQGSDGYVLVVPSSFKGRLFMSSPHVGCNLTMNAIALGSSSASIAGTANTGCKAVLERPWQTTVGGDKDAYFGAWSLLTGYAP
ncbi:MAG: hypothetical protein ACKO37_04700 [Vampirovibrionales bacterium]